MTLPNGLFCLFVTMKGRLVQKVLSSCLVPSLSKTYWRPEPPTLCLIELTPDPPQLLVVDKSFFVSCSAAFTVKCGSEQLTFNYCSGSASCPFYMQALNAQKMGAAAVSPLKAHP